MCLWCTAHLWKGRLGCCSSHDDLIKWKHFLRYWAFFPTQRPVTWSFDVFFDLRLNQQLSKQWRCRWFETLLRSLWRNCNVNLLRLLLIFLVMAVYYFPYIKGIMKYSCNLLSFLDCIIFISRKCYSLIHTLQWRHNERDDVSNYQRLDC